MIFMATFLWSRREISKQTPQGLHRSCRSFQHLLLKFQQESSYWLIRDLGQASALSTACMTPKATPGHLKLANLMCWEHLTLWAAGPWADWLWVSLGKPCHRGSKLKGLHTPLAGGALWPAAAVLQELDLTGHPWLLCSANWRCSLATASSTYQLFFLHFLIHPHWSSILVDHCLSRFSQKCLAWTGFGSWYLVHTKMYSNRLRLRKKLVLLVFFNC